MIQVEALTKSFGANRVLRGVDLEVPKGSISIIIGRSGGGSSGPALARHRIAPMTNGATSAEALNMTVPSSRCPSGNAANGITIPPTSTISHPPFRCASLTWPRSSSASVQRKSLLGPRTCR